MKSFAIADIKDSGVKLGTGGEFVNSGKKLVVGDSVYNINTNRRSKYYANGCWRNPADTTLPPHETGCFTCPFTKCMWEPYDKRNLEYVKSLNV